MPDWIKRRALITVRTYPVPSEKSIEASCTAGVTDNGEWIRLFPVPYRLMDHEKRFSKWQWIDVNVLKANDGRPESYKINPDSVSVAEQVGTKDGWRARRQIIEPLRRKSLCRIQRERDENGSPTLGIFRPHRIRRLIVERSEKNWTSHQLSILKQDTLFQRSPDQTLEKIPFDFRYEFQCGDNDCTGHTLICTDWEMSQAYRAWRVQYGDKWEAAFRNRFEKEMIEKFDTHFFVGTVHQYPKSWIIVGLFYPPKQSTHDLFC
jgi:hypothetical protein